MSGNPSSAPPVCTSSVAFCSFCANNGALLANLLGGLGIWDITLGSLATLAAAWLTRRWRRSWVAYLPPILVNGLVVGWYLTYLIHLPGPRLLGSTFLGAALSIGVSEAVIVLVLGVPLVALLRRAGLGE
ncbi:MAG: QueT transporter family protein [Chitinophagales bacterium]